MEAKSREFSLWLFIVPFTCLLFGCPNAADKVSSNNLDAIAPKVINKFPEDKTIGYIPTNSVTLTFSKPVSHSTVNINSFFVQDKHSQKIDATVTLDSSATFAVLTPIQPLRFNSDYFATVTTEVKNGVNSLEQEVKWSFSTGRQLTAGSNHTCARLNNGQVKCWGGNSFGQLGMGNRNSLGDNLGEMGGALPSVSLVADDDPSLIVEIKAGYFHTCVRLDDGRIKCWGDNESGQLGLENTENRGDQDGEMGSILPSVALVGSDERAQVVEIAAGSLHTCARFSNGRIKCWGDNRYGQLGLGNIKNRGDQAGEMGVNLPWVELVAPDDPATVLQIAAGQYHSCARLSDGRIKCWGFNAFGQLGIGDKLTRGDQPGEMGTDLQAVQLDGIAVDMTLGELHSCARMSDGRIYCWGLNNFGQLGLGDCYAPTATDICDPTKNRGDEPGEMGNALPASVLVSPSEKASVIELAAGGRHNCARFNDGRVKCWGLNGHGQLGIGDNNTRGDQPGEMGSSLPGLSLGDAVAELAAGESHTCALLSNSEIKCWGNNDSGQLGLGDCSDTANILCNPSKNRGDAPGEMGANLSAVVIE